MTPLPVGLAARLYALGVVDRTVTDQNVMAVLQRAADKGVLPLATVLLAALDHGRAEHAALIRDLAEAYHQTGSIRDHNDESDKTGWNVKGIETCSDSLCVDALAALPKPEGADDAG